MLRVDNVPDRLFAPPCSKKRIAPDNFEEIASSNKHLKDGNHHTKTSPSTLSSTTATILSKQASVTTKASAVTPRKSALTSRAPPTVGPKPTSAAAAGTEKGTAQSSAAEFVASPSATHTPMLTVDTKQKPKVQKSEVPGLAQCLDRGGGISKGSVRSFIALMGKLLDPANQAKFVSALRLTERHPKRLTRFVNHGGVGRLILWMEAALTSREPTTDQLLDGTFKVLRLLPLRLLEKGLARSLLELTGRVRARLKKASQVAHNTYQNTGSIQKEDRPRSVLSTKAAVQPRTPPRKTEVHPEVILEVQKSSHALRSALKKPSNSLRPTDNVHVTSYRFFNTGESAINATLQHSNSTERANEVTPHSTSESTSDWHRWSAQSTHWPAQVQTYNQQNMYWISNNSVNNVAYKQHASSMFGHADAATYATSSSSYRNDAESFTAERTQGQSNVLNPSIALAELAESAVPRTPPLDSIGSIDRIKAEDVSSPKVSIPSFAPEAGPGTTAAEWRYQLPQTPPHDDKAPVTPPLHTDIQSEAPCTPPLEELYEEFRPSTKGEWENEKVSNDRVLHPHQMQQDWSAAKMRDDHQFMYSHPLGVETVADHSEDQHIGNDALDDSTLPDQRLLDWSRLHEEMCALEAQISAAVAHEQQGGDTVNAARRDALSPLQNRAAVFHAKVQELERQLSSADVSVGLSSLRSAASKSNGTAGDMQGKAAFALSSEIDLADADTEDSETESEGSEAGDGCAGRSGISGSVEPEIVEALDSLAAWKQEYTQIPLTPVSNHVKSSAAVVELQR